MYKSELVKLLPNEGSIVRRQLHESNSIAEGVVVYVNRENLWYLVEFELGNKVKIRRGYKPV